MINCSVFNKSSKNIDTTTHSTNVEEQRLKKANELYEKSSLFKTQINPTDKKINPLLIPKLERKQNQQDREKTAGKNWGHMKKVELTDEIKADLRAIKLRNQLFSNRFYKTNDAKKLPEYFQIGTVVDDARDLSSRSDRWTKKQRKGTIAQQFLTDDASNGFSKRKYEQLNEKKRRMGDKKKSITMHKKKAKDLKSQGISSGSKNIGKKK